MKKETRIKVINTFYRDSEDNSSVLARRIIDENNLFRVLKICHNNRLITHLGDIYKSLFRLDFLKFEECIGGVCDMGHFHVEKYKPIDKPVFYDKAVKLYNDWIKECEKKHQEYLETKKTEEDKQREEDEYNNYLRLHKKFQKEKEYKCPDCGTETFEGDTNHYRIWDTDGGHCIGVKK